VAHILFRTGTGAVYHKIYHKRISYTVPVDRYIAVADDPAIGEYAVSLVGKEQHEGPTVQT
jgi:hypothetical protein